MKHFLTNISILLATTTVFSQSVQKIKITDLEKTIAEAKTPLIINFWATFCKPCIEEMPYFQEEVKKRSKDSLRLLLVSLDLEENYAAKIRAFVQKRKISSRVVWLDEFDADYFCPKVDPQWSGAIPATLFINNRKGYRKFFEEQLSKEKLVKEIGLMIGAE